MKSAPGIIQILLALYIINSHGTEFNPPPMSDIIVDDTLKPAVGDEYRSKCEARKRSETTRYTFIAFISAYKMQHCA